MVRIHICRQSLHVLFAWAILSACHFGCSAATHRLESEPTYEETVAPPPAVDDTEAPAAVVTGLSLSDYETRIRDTSLAAEARLAMAKEYVARAAVEGSAADLSDALKILTSITGPDKTAALKEVVDRTIHAAELERAIANVARGSEIMPLLQARQALLWWHTGKATKASELADGLQLSDDGVR